MHCKKCKTTEGYLTVGSTKKRKDGSKYIQYICGPCNASKKRRELHRNPAAAHRATARWRAKFPYKHRAQLLARKQIPLEPCEVCGADAVRHHPDYSQPLLVRFLCNLHHKQVHLGLLCLK